MFATSSLDHSEARNDQGRRVKLEFKTIVKKLLRFESHNIMFLCLLRKGPIFEPKKSCATNGLRQKSLFIPGGVQGSIIRVLYRLRELYEADFHKPGIYGIGQVWANAWDAFRRALSRVVAVAGLMWVSCCVFGGADFFVLFFFPDFFFERTRPAASMRPPCLIYLSTFMYINES